MKVNTALHQSVCLCQGRRPVGVLLALTSTDSKLCQAILIQHWAHMNDIGPNVVPPSVPTGSEQIPHLRKSCEFFSRIKEIYTTMHPDQNSCRNISKPFYFPCFIYNIKHCFCCQIFLYVLLRSVGKFNYTKHNKAEQLNSSPSTNLTNPTMHLSHIPQYTIQNRDVGVLWDMGQVHCGICEIGLSYFHSLSEHQGHQWF